MTAFGAVFAAVFAAALVACKGTASEQPGPCFGCEPSPVIGEETALVVDNRTTHSVTITVRELPALWIERKVLDGTFTVPIAPASRGTTREEVLAPGGRTILSQQLGIITDTDVLPATGGIAAIGSGPAVLAVGKGRLLVRTREGADILEAEDPREVTVLPVDGEVDACAEGTFGAEVPALPALGDMGPRPVDSVTRDAASGCRVFHLTERGTPVEYRACVPDAAYPFAEGDAFTFSYFIDNSVRLERDDGTALELVPLRFDARRPTTYRTMTIAYVAQATCTSIEPACKDVMMPVKVVSSFDGATSQTHVVGDSFVDVTDARRTIFVVGAVSRPVVDPSCDSRTPRPFGQTEVFLAIVERPVPGP